MTTPIITGPGEYRTRSGEKVVITKRLNGMPYPWEGTNSAGTRTSWCEDGRCYRYGDPFPLDIIGPWERPGDRDRDFVLPDGPIPEQTAPEPVSAAPLEAGKTEGAWRYEVWADAHGWLLGFVWLPSSNKPTTWHWCKATRRLLEHGPSPSDLPPLPSDLTDAAHAAAVEAAARHGLHDKDAILAIARAVEAARAAGEQADG